MFLAVNFVVARKLLSTDSFIEHLLCTCPSSGSEGNGSLGLRAMGDAPVLAECRGAIHIHWLQKWGPFSKNSALKRWTYSALTLY